MLVIGERRRRRAWNGRQKGFPAVMEKAADIGGIEDRVRDVG
jgi:hypothetical protein